MQDVSDLDGEPEGVLVASLRRRVSLAGDENEVSSAACADSVMRRIARFRQPFLRPRAPGGFPPRDAHKGSKLQRGVVPRPPPRDLGRHRAHDPRDHVQVIVAGRKRSARARPPADAAARSASSPPPAPRRLLSDAAVGRERGIRAAQHVVTRQSVIPRALVAAVHLLAPPASPPLTRAPNDRRRALRLPQRRQRRSQASHGDPRGDARSVPFPRAASPSIAPHVSDSDASISPTALWHHPQHSASSTLAGDWIDTSGASDQIASPRVMRRVATTPTPPAAHEFSTDTGAPTTDASDAWYVSTPSLSLRPCGGISSPSDVRLDRRPSVSSVSSTRACAPAPPSSPCPPRRT